jgi:hypothetical protein
MAVAQRAADLLRTDFGATQVVTFNLNPSRLPTLSAGLRACLEMTRRDLSAFILFLEQLSETEASSFGSEDD